jgi:hypothetical protein
MLHFSLIILITFGLWGGLNVSFLTITGEAPCPDITGIPICYLVSVGYFLMLISQLFSKSKAASKLFCFGWGLVFLIALIGVVFEVTIGGVCPVSTQGTPLCYLSLIFSLLIIGLYLYLNKSKS